MSKAKQQAQEYKEKGNKSFAADKFAESITWYTKAIQSDPTDHVLYSNRSAAYLHTWRGKYKWKVYFLFFFTNGYIYHTIKI